MKASELRIGNWVYKISAKEDTQIFALGIVGHAQCDIANQNWDYEPIPLTKEWLVRIDWNGYKYLYFNSNFCLDEQGHLYYHNDYTGINVHHVHTLQNIYFALTGEELTIVSQPETPTQHPPEPTPSPDV